MTTSAALVAIRPERSDLTISQLWHRLSCALFGHHVNDLKLDAAHEGNCRCGTTFLAPTPRVRTRVRHTASCFLFGHRYHQIATRDGYNEYLCGHCGHTLLFSERADPFADRGTFLKRVRYFCNLFGHTVQTVTERHGFTEYACGCGHVFLSEEAGARTIKHPAVCLFAGHFVRFVTHRDGCAEFQCEHCGHPFCFATGS